MAVYNHLQLLAYYAKPNNLISGTIVNGDVTRVACIYDWHGAEHMLISGTYNLLNGHIESAVLREFARYEDMWSDMAGADMPETEQESRSNVEGGSASGGSSSTYSNTTTVNIGSGGGDIDTSNFATKDELKAKQDKIYDLDTIRSGAALGATALQSYTEKYTGTYNKPSTGIPKTDLASDVQTSLGKADTALQNIPDTYATKTNLAEALAPIGTLYKGAWIAKKTEGISQLYTERITLPAGTYIVSCVLPYAKVGHGNQICIGFTAKMAIGVGNTFLDASYGCTTMLATFTTTTNLAVMSAASANSAEWDYLDRGGIAALRIK
jgi:hypothetical protein